MSFWMLVYQNITLDSQFSWKSIHFHNAKNHIQPLVIHLWGALGRYNLCLLAYNIPWKVWITKNPNALYVSKHEKPISKLKDKIDVFWDTTFGFWANDKLINIFIAQVGK